MATLTVAEYGIGGLGNVTSAADAVAQLNKSQNDPKLIAAYDATLANAAATFYAVSIGHESKK